MIFFGCLPFVDIQNRNSTRATAAVHVGPESTQYVARWRSSSFVSAHCSGHLHFMKGHVLIEPEIPHTVHVRVAYVDVL